MRPAVGLLLFYKEKNEENENMKNYKIAVAGTGYVGLSLSVLLAQHNQVMAVDIVQAKVDMINNHKSPIQDDYIEKYLAEKELNLTATLDAKAAYSDADFVVIAAPTNYDSHTQHFDTYVRKNAEHGVENKELSKRISALPGKKNEAGGAIKFVPLSSEELSKANYKELVETRHSIRHFSDKPVELERVENAVKLAQYTPSACNRQGWKTYIVNDKAVLREVLKNQNGNRGFGQEFDKLLVVVGDLRCFNRDREVFQVYIDGGMYAMRVLDSLYYERIASVPLSASLTKEQEENVRKLLKLDPAEVLIMFIGIGNYPDECQTTRSERKPAEYTVI